MVAILNTSSNSKSLSSPHIRPVTNPLTSSELREMTLENGGSFESTNEAGNTQTNHIIVVERIKNKIPRDFMENSVAVVGSIICMLSCTSGLTTMSLFIRKLYRMSENDYGVEKFPSVFQDVTILLVAMIYSLVGFSFSLILMKGVKNRAPLPVMIFLVHGALNVVNATVLLLTLNINYNLQTVYTVAFLTILAFYILFLNVVWSTYDKYEKMEERQRHAKRMEPVTLPLALAGKKI